jgi:hypothetical protein
VHEFIFIETFLCPKLPDKVVISWCSFASIWPR